MADFLSYSDEQLFALLAEKEERALEILFERYRDRLYYYLLKHTKSPEVSEEIVSDIFIKLWKGRDVAHLIKEPSAFFHKVAYFKAMDFIRTTARHSRLKEAYIKRMEHAEEKMADDLLIDNDIQKWLLKAINQLPPQRKTVYQLSRQEGLSHEEIAKKLKLSKSTVNNTILSATRSVMNYLNDNVVGKAALSLIFFFY